jgi:hypothetical protein
MKLAVEIIEMAIDAGNDFLERAQQSRRHISAAAPL